jgi:hypothetical protein
LILGLAARQEDAAGLLVPLGSTVIGGVVGAWVDRGWNGPPRRLVFRTSMNSAREAPDRRLTPPKPLDGGRWTFWTTKSSVRLPDLGLPDGGRSWCCRASFPGILVNVGATPRGASSRRGRGAAEGSVLFGDHSAGIRRSPA